jgi:hypothetical protein
MDKEADRHLFLALEPDAYEWKIIKFVSSQTGAITTFSTNFRSSLYKNIFWTHFSELPNIYLSPDIKQVSELYGQQLYIIKF